jgi:hypothetical protein
MTTHTHTEHSSPEPRPAARRPPATAIVATVLTVLLASVGS